MFYNTEMSKLQSFVLLSLPLLQCQRTLFWPHSPLTLLAPEEEARSASSAPLELATTQRLTLGMTSTVFMETSEVAPAQAQHPGKGEPVVCEVMAHRSSLLASM